VLGINLPAGTGRFLCALRDPDLFHRALRPVLAAKAQKRALQG
jgi:hypothetical protein